MKGKDMQHDGPGRTTNTVTPIDRIPFLRLLGLQQEPSEPGARGCGYPICATTCATCCPRRTVVC